MAELSTTLAGAALARAAAAPESLAFLQKRYGIWERHGWGACARWIEDCALGLDAEGTQRGETVAILSGQRIDAVLAVYACQLAGLRPLLLHPTIAPGALASYCEEAGVSILIAEDQEQVDKAADVLSRLPQLQRLLVIDAKGVRGYRHVKVEPLAAVVEQGGALDGRAAALAVRTALLSGSAPGLALYSGGVCGDARLLTFSHHALLTMMQGARGRVPFAAGALLAAQFALADPLGHFFCVAAPAVTGAVPCFGEGRMLTQIELREASPALVAAPARAYERMRRETVARIERAGGVRQALFTQVLAHGAASGPLAWLAGRPLLNALGLARATWLGCGYDQLSAASTECFAHLGKSVTGIYSLADAAGPVAVLAAGNAASTPASPTLQWFSHVSAQLDGASELLVRSSGNAQWMATGDLALQTTGGMQLLGRGVDCLHVAEGDPVQAGLIERELAVSTFVNQAVAVGGPATGITALIELDETAVRDWARMRGLAFTTARSLADSAEVQQIASDAVARANQCLPLQARIARHIVLPRPLDPGNGELTASLALRRAFVRNRYAHRLFPD